MTSMPYPLPISAMLLQCCDPSDDEGRHEHLGDENFDPWSDGPPAGYCHPQVEREELQRGIENTRSFAEQLRNAYKSLLQFLQRGTS